MIVTRKTVADKLTAYLRHKIELNELVDWAENAMMDGEFESAHLSQIRDSVSRLGLADVRAFGLTWADCEKILNQIGYSARVKISAA